MVGATSRKTSSRTRGGLEDGEQDYRIIVWGDIRSPINPCIFQRMAAVGIYLRILQLSYEAAKKRAGAVSEGRPRLPATAEPYTKIVEELPQMGREAVQLVRQAVGAGRRVYVLLNNRAEGNALLTVQGLSEMLRR